MKTGELVHHLRVLDCEQCYLCRECKGPHKLKCFLLGEAADTLEAQQKRIKDLEAGRRWIPVTERLPESGVRVIVCRGDKVEQGVFLGVNGWWKVYGTNTKKVTHWMPLPEPPKEV